MNPLMWFAVLRQVSHGPTGVDGRSDGFAVVTAQDLLLVQRTSSGLSEAIKPEAVDSAAWPIAMRHQHIRKYHLA